MDELQFIVINEEGLGGLMDFIKSEIGEYVTLYYVIGGAKIGELNLKNGTFTKNIKKLKNWEVGRIIRSDKNKSDSPEACLRSTLRLSNLNQLKESISLIEELVRKICGATGINPVMAIDTNIVRNGLLEQIIAEMTSSGKEEWQGVQILTPKIVLQELFRDYSTYEFKNGLAEKYGILKFPKRKSREARYALSVISFGSEKGIVQFHGKILLIEAGHEKYKYLSDLVLLDQIEEYAMRQTRPVIFITSDYALSTISHIKPTKYIKPPQSIKLDEEGKCKIPSIKRFIRDLLICFGLISLKNDANKNSNIIVLSYSWKGITLEDYIKRNIALAVSKSLMRNIQKFVTIVRPLTTDETPWMKIVKEFTEELSTSSL